MRLCGSRNEEELQRLGENKHKPPLARLLKHLSLTFLLLALGSLLASVSLWSTFILPLLPHNGTTSGNFLALVDTTDCAAVPICTASGSQNLPDQCNTPALNITQPAIPFFFLSQEGLSFTCNLSMIHQHALVPASCPPYFDLVSLFEPTLVLTLNYLYAQNPIYPVDTWLNVSFGNASVLVQPRNNAQYLSVSLTSTNLSAALNISIFWQGGPVTSPGFLIIQSAETTCQLAAKLQTYVVLGLLTLFNVLFLSAALVVVWRGSPAGPRDHHRHNPNPKKLALLLIVLVGATSGLSVWWTRWPSELSEEAVVAGLALTWTTAAQLGRRWARAFLVIVPVLVGLGIYALYVGGRQAQPSGSLAVLMSTCWLAAPGVANALLKRALPRENDEKTKVHLKRLAIVVGVVGLACLTIPVAGFGLVAGSAVAYASSDVILREVAHRMRGNSWQGQMTFFSALLLLALVLLILGLQYLPRPQGTAYSDLLILNLEHAAEALLIGALGSCLQIISQIDRHPPSPLDDAEKGPSIVGEEVDLN